MFPIKDMIRAAEQGVRMHDPLSGRATGIGLNHQVGLSPVRSSVLLG